MWLTDLLLVVLGLYVSIPKILFFFTYSKKVFASLGSSDMLKSQFKSKEPWVLITGCTAGIGEQIAYKLAKEGFNLVLVSRSISKLNNVE